MGGKEKDEIRWAITSSRRLRRSLYFQANVASEDRKHSQLELTNATQSSKEGNFVDANLALFQRVGILTCLAEDLNRRAGTRKVSWQFSSALSSQSKGPPRTKSVYIYPMATSTYLGFSASCEQLLRSNIMKKQRRTRLLPHSPSRTT